MFKNWLHTILRNFSRHKGYTILNISGLAIGMACAGLIFLWVNDETSYDEHHEKRERLYSVVQHWKMDNAIHTWWSTPNPMGPALKQGIPAIEDVSRTSEVPVSPLITVGDKSIYSTGLYAEPSYFNLFTVPLISGKYFNASSQLYSILLTENAAIKFFGTTTGVIGKTLRFDHNQDYTVAGIIKDPPVTSAFNYEWIAPYEIYEKENEYLKNWGSNGIRTYVLLRPGANDAAVSKQIKNILLKNTNSTHQTPFLHSIKDWRLRSDFVEGKQSGGRIEYVRLFSTVAWIILAIACINFMNLSTARSEKRAKEVGVKKVLGAERKSLVFQFISEALFMSFVAALVAVLLIVLVLPLFNNLVNKNLSINIFDPQQLLALVVIVLGCGLIAGSYPSLYLSSFKPVFVLKGIKIKSSAASYIRRGLVVTQFSVSIILIIGTLIIYQQIKHVKSRDVGFEKEQLMIIKAKGDMMQRFDAIRNDLYASGMVTSAAMSDYGILYDGNNTTNFYWQGKEPGKEILTSIRMVGPGYVKTTGLELKEGREFLETDRADSIQNVKTVLITESLAKLMGKGSALGKKIMAQRGEAPNNEVSATVVGVVKDFVYGNMYRKSDPVIFFYYPKNANNIYVRTKPGYTAQQVISKFAEVINRHNPAYPFEYEFVSDQFNNLFSGETLVSKLSRIFAILAIFICCLGLFGLAAHTAEQRFKEIGIRKVLGASSVRVVRLLSYDFLKLVLFSCIIAFPAALWAMNSWLEQYAYRIKIGPLVFLFAGAIAMIIAFITISFQTIRAAAANPVNTLRTE